MKRKTKDANPLKLPPADWAALKDCLLAAPIQAWRGHVEKTISSKRFAGNPVAALLCRYLETEDHAVLDEAARALTGLSASEKVWLFLAKS